MRFHRTALLAGATLLGALVFSGVPTRAVDDSVLDDNLFEIGVNEDVNEDHDIDITKGPNAGQHDPRANIAGFNVTPPSPGLVGCVVTGVDVTGSPATDPCGTPTSADLHVSEGHGPDWADLFTGVLDTDPTRAFVVPSLRDIRTGPLPFASATPDDNGKPDFQDYGGIAATFIGDDISAANLTDQTTMVSSGSDSNSDLPPTYVWGTDSVPKKNDFTNSYCYATAETGDLVIYCGFERLSPSGASHLDIELNQNEIGLDEAPPCVDAGDPSNAICHFVGNRKDNDLLISLNYSNGGDFGGLEIRKWDETNAVTHAGTWGDAIVTLGAEGCNTAFNGTAADVACAFSNNGDINGGPWPNFIDSATPLDSSPFTSGLLPRNAFGEFGLNVTGLLGTTPCFTTVQGKTRTSTAFSSQLKDFVIADFNVCSADVTTEVHDASHTDVTNGTVTVGDVVHDEATVTGTNPGGGTDDPTGTVDFTLYDNGTCNGSVVDSDSDVAIPVDGIADNTATVESKTTTVNTPGTYSYQAHYDGDSNYPAATGPCEPFTVESPQLKIVKQIVNACEGDANDPGRFDLRIEGTTYKTAAGDGDDTGFQNAGPDPAVDFDEIGNGTTDLDDYVKTVSGTDCVEGTADDGAGTVPLADSDQKTCTITNTRKATVNVTKQLVPSDDTGTFDLDIANNLISVGTGTESSPATATFDAASSSVVVSEAASGTTSLSDYQTFISCDNGTEATGTAAAAFGVISGETVNCVITNVRKIEQAACPVPPTP